MASRASSTSRGAASGAVDEDSFTKAFEDVPSINVSSAKEVNDKFSKIKDILADGSQDWEKRISALKEIRSLVIAGAPDLIDIVAQLRILDPGFQLSVKDLRSQVVREACITVSFLAVRLEHKFEFNAETLMPILVGLIQNSAKVMSTSGVVAIRFIVKNTHASRLIPTLVTHVSSKASIIRKQCLMFVDLLLNTWPRQAMERHVAILQEAIKKGLSDADSDARMYSRRAFGCFAEHFREQAFTLLNSFDAAKQRQLLAELDNPSIFNDLNLKKTSRSKSTERTASSGIQSSWRHTTEPGGDGGVGVALSTPDLIPIQKPESTIRRNNSLRGGPSTTPSLGVYKARKNSVTSVEQSHRSRTTSKGISQSQPGSRSGSPSSRLVYVSNLQPDVASTSVKATSTLSRPRPRRKTANSQGSSREGSPDRKLGQDFKAGVQSLRQASGRVSPSPRKASLTLQCMAEYGKDLETHITDALRQRRFRSDDGSDAASETSSVCSENSLRSGPDGLSDDVAEVMALLLSGSWADRREGLVMLQRILRSERRLTHSELKRVTEVFTRMFHDPHSKVMSVFLEAFVDFVTAHSCDLTDWFPVCLTRLLAKAGSDVLGSMQSKITRALDALRDSFPHHHQFSCVTRFIVEQAQIPNVKVKLVLLTYLQGLICQMEPSCFSNNSDTRLAVSRVITWTSEPKSPEVRKAAQNVLIALMHLNSAELSVILSVLPKSFQEGASKVLAGVQLSPGDSAKIQASRTAFASASTPGRVGMRSRSSIDSNDAAEVFSAEDVYNGIKKASEDIQHLSLLGRQLDLSLAKRNLLEQDDGLTGDIMVTSESIEEILVELSSADNTLEERLKALNQLMSVIKKCQSEQIWEKHFKMVLLLLLETMRDSSGKVRSNCLLALKELLDAQPERFRPYAELTILSLLEFEKDTDREVMRAAEDCGGALAKAISTEQAISILNPISLTADFPINLAAIKLETKVVQAASESNVRSLMPDMIPGLIKGFENAESSVRKTSMLCLLSIHQSVGDSLMSQLTTLHPSKMKLLNLYIKRSEEQKGRPGMAFEPVSPT